MICMYCPHCGVATAPGVAADADGNYTCAAAPCRMTFRVIQWPAPRDPAAIAHDAADAIALNDRVTDVVNASRRHGKPEPR